MSDLEHVQSNFVTLLVRCIEPTGIHQKLIKATAAQLEHLIDLKIKAALEAQRTKETSIEPPRIATTPPSPAPEDELHPSEVKARATEQAWLEDKKEERRPRRVRTDETVSEKE